MYLLVSLKPGTGPNDEYICISSLIFSFISFYVLHERYAFIAIALPLIWKCLPRQPQPHGWSNFFRTPIHVPDTQCSLAYKRSQNISISLISSFVAHASHYFLILISHIFFILFHTYFTLSLRSLWLCIIRWVVTGVIALRRGFLWAPTFQPPLEILKLAGYALIPVTATTLICVRGRWWWKTGFTRYTMIYAHRKQSRHMWLRGFSIFRHFHAGLHYFPRISTQHGHTGCHRPGIAIIADYDAATAFIWLYIFIWLIFIISPWYYNIYLFRCRIALWFHSIIL